jgi:hypothetical protein
MRTPLWHGSDGTTQLCSGAAMQHAAVKGPTGSRERKVRGICSAQRVVFEGPNAAAFPSPLLPTPASFAFRSSLPILRVISGPTPRAQPGSMSASCHGPTSLLNLHPLPTDAEGGDSPRLSTRVANRAFSDLANHDVSDMPCPSARRRSTAALHRLQCTWTCGSGASDIPHCAGRCA